MTTPNEPNAQQQSAPNSDTPPGQEEQQPVNQEPVESEVVEEQEHGSSVEPYDLEMPADVPPSRLAEWGPVLGGFGKAAAAAGFAHGGFVAGPSPS